MKKNIFVVLLISLYFHFAGAELDQNVFIVGTIHSYDKDQVKIIDEHKQIFSLPIKKLKQQQIKSGQLIQLEMSLDEFEKLEMRKIKN